MSKKKKELAQQLSDLWNENQGHMSEMAAYEVSCEWLGIDSDDGWELLALLDEEGET